MRLALNLSLLLFALFIFEKESFSLTDYQIKIICKKEKRQFTCIRNLKEKKSIIQKGNVLEIPVVPFKR
jgi:hypothetical protein